MKAKYGIVDEDI
jgi:hypothetical protein